MKVENLLYSNEFRVEIEGGERIADLVKCVHFDLGKGEVRITFYETKQLDVMKFLQEWIDNKKCKDVTIWMGNETRGMKLLDCVAISYIFDDLGNTLFTVFECEDDLEEDKGYVIDITVFIKFTNLEIVEKNKS